MKTNKLVILAIAVLLILPAIIYRYAFMKGSIETAQAIDKIGHLQIVRLEATNNALEAIKTKTILPSSGNSAAKLIDGIFLDFMLIQSILTDKQIQAICFRVKQSEVSDQLKSSKLFGDPDNNWDQPGVKGVINLCDSRSPAASG